MIVTRTAENRKTLDDPWQEPQGRQEPFHLYLGDPAHADKKLLTTTFRAAAKDSRTYHLLLDRNDPVRHEVLKPISDHIEEAFGIWPKEWSGLPITHLLPVDGGTTRAFSMILKLLQKYRSESPEIRTKTPVLIAPAPTYGYFTGAAYDEGFKVVRVPRDLKTGKIERDVLLTALQKTLRDKTKYIAAYYDCSPHNPLGTIRDQEEADMVGDLLRAATKKQQERLGGGVEKNILIIDDLIYNGLEFGNKKTIPFARNPALYPQTLTLLGLSKIGLPGLRAGLIVGDDDSYLYELNRASVRENYCPSQPVMQGLRLFFSNADKDTQRNKTSLKSLNETHRAGLNLMKVLINGADALQELPSDDQEAVLKIWGKETGRTKDQAVQDLSRGIPGVRVITNPQAGFFHLLDFEERRNWHYDYAYKIRNTLSNQEELEKFLKGNNLHMAAGQWCGLSEDQMVMRATAAMPAKEIIAFARRLKRCMADLKEPPPLHPKPALWTHG